MTRVVFTGAHGFIGKAVADALRSRSEVDLVCLVRAGTVRRDDEIEVDLIDEEAVAAALAKVRPAAVIHAAGRVPGTPFELFRDNAVTSVVLANAVLKACPGAVLTALGSAAEYGRPASAAPITEDHPCNPLTPYGHAKLAASRYLLAGTERGLRLNLLRVFNPIAEVNSPAQVLGAFIDKAVRLLNARTRVVTMGRLDAVRDFVALDDLVHLIQRLVAGDASGHLLNVCSGKGYRIRDLIQFLVTRSGLDYEVVETGEPPPVDRPDIIVGDPTRFLAASGLSSPTSILDTLARAWDRAAQASSQGACGGAVAVT